MPSCPWDTCGAGPGRGLVGFLWGTPEAFADSCSWAFRDVGPRLPGADPRLSPRGFGRQLTARAPVLALSARARAIPRQASEAAPRASAGVVTAGAVRCRS